MRFARDCDFIQAISPDGTDEPFDMFILPERAGRGWWVPDAYRLHFRAGRQPGVRSARGGRTASIPPSGVDVAVCLGSAPQDDRSARSAHWMC